MKLLTFILAFSTIPILVHTSFLKENFENLDATTSDLPQSVDATDYILSCFKSPPTLNIKYYNGFLPIGGPIEVYPNYYVYTTEATGKDSKMYYMLVSADGSSIKSPTQTDQEKPLILWLQGGPGCGGMFAFSAEMGPFRAHLNSKDEIDFEENIYSWTKFAYMLFIDQPIGVGLSPVIGNETINTNSTEIAMAVVDSVLEQFFTVYPQLKANPFYIFGESYAGHYAPSLAARILAKQANNKDKFINLQGMGIGDGWTDPLLQNQAYAPYLFSAGVISSYRVDYYKKTGGKIAEYIFTQQFQKANDLAYLFDGNTGPNGEITLTQTNDLNYRDYFQNYPSQDNFQKWLGLSETISKLQLDKKLATNYQFCSNALYFAFTWTASHSFVSNYSIILENLPVLIYEGQVDPDVSTNGVLNMLQNVQWQGINKFRKAQKQFLFNEVNGKQVGIFKQYGKLKFVLVNDAGHLVPHDQPEIAFQVVKNYFVDQGFNI